ncbi:MAG: neutral zinc metallopeptidase, partial [Pseudomonadota bacterium]
MRWRGRRQSGNVRDMRGQSGGGGMGLPGGIGFPGGRRGGGIRIPMGGRRGGGSFGCGTLIVIGLVLWMLGINPLNLLGGLGGGLGGGLNPSTSPNTTSPQIDRTTGTGGREDEMRQFVATILGSTEEVWTEIFKSYGKQYPKPELVLFSGGVRSACGSASSASGPFYCPGDNRVYIDLTFFRQLAQQFGAPGDFAQAYVIAHEVGHHVQNVIGILPQFNRMRQSMPKLEVNRMSVKVELQADCFAGVWGHYVARQGWLEQGDLEEALVAANQIGDDTIQKKTQGYVVPDAFNHGTAEQRRSWFRKGFES